MFAALSARDAPVSIPHPEAATEILRAAANIQERKDCGRMQAATLPTKIAAAMRRCGSML